MPVSLRVRLPRYLGVLCFLLLANPTLSQTPAGAPRPDHLAWAATPPMGWNSYDAFGDSVTEEEVLANASYVQAHLLAHGWQYVVIDFRWYDPHAYHNRLKVPGESGLEIDKFGRYLPAPARFPSSANGAGFKPLADKVHAMGLKFGIHIMRGIPRPAVKADMPIEGSDAHAWDATSFSVCPWNKDMLGVDATRAPGRAYYDSIFRLYAAWGLDFVKVDDLSSAYQEAEIHAIRESIDRCGRPIVFSTSPGPTPIMHADDIMAQANMWRVSGDFWDRWKELNHAFDLAFTWSGHGGPGHWPDYDMLPLGKIGLRCEGQPRLTQFTHDEQQLMMTLWALGPSPLMLGGNLPENDEWTADLITNDEVLAVNQDPLGKQGARVAQTDGVEIWVRELRDGSRAIGLFNRGDAPATATLTWTEAGLTGKQSVRDLWQHKELGVFDQTFAAPVPAHGVVFLGAKAVAP